MVDLRTNMTSVSALLRTLERMSLDFFNFIAIALISSELWKHVRVHPTISLPFSQKDKKAW